MSGNDNPRFHCVRRNRWIPVPVPKPPGQRRHCLHDDLATSLSLQLKPGHKAPGVVQTSCTTSTMGAGWCNPPIVRFSIPLLTLGTTQIVWLECSHTPAAPDGAKMVQRWCRVTQKLRRRRHPPTIVTSSTSDCQWAQASDKIQLLWLSQSQTNIFGDKNSTSARYHSEKH